MSQLWFWYKITPPYCTIFFSPRRKGSFRYFTSTIWLNMFSLRCEYFPFQRWFVQHALLNLCRMLLIPTVSLSASLMIGASRPQIYRIIQIWNGCEKYRVLWKFFKWCSDRWIRYWCITNLPQFTVLFQDRESTAHKIIKETANSFLIPPFDHPHIMAGQGTIGLELLDQVCQFIYMWNIF